MSDPLDEAQAEARAAREQLKSTFMAAQNRLHPRALSHEVIERAKEQVAAKAQAVADGITSRPSLIASALAATALVLLRKPIIGAIRRQNKEKDHG
jgi:Protein of unknown function (DUF3618)